MVYADLHVHTTVSDGTLEPETVPSVASEAGLSVVAVTDHDRLNPEFDPPIVEFNGLILINGIELRVELSTGERVDLLGYAVEPTTPLEDEVDRLQRDRKERGAAIVDQVETRLGVDLDIEVGPGLGRPHIARTVVANSNTSYEETDEVFADLIGDSGPCFVARDVPSFDRGVSLLSDACALVALAHPMRYGSPDRALQCCEELDAVERHYPYEHPVETAPIQRAIDQFDLLATGGSDAHGEQLGMAGLTERAFEPLRHAIPGA